jgi:all-trans-retinol 13,14-reductase
MEKYDIVIVGSGLGGLVCATILGKRGYKVCILEKNKQIGGNLQTFVRERVIFDSGVHYLGGLLPGQNLYQIFKYLGIMDDLKLQRMDMDAFDIFLLGNDDKEYRIAQGYDNFIEQLSKDFPEERHVIEQYCAKMLEICEQFPLYRLRDGSYFERIDALEMDTKAYIETLTSNEKLQAVLGGNNALYAGVGGKTPLYVHALVVNSYIESSWRCVDGGSQIARLLNKKIREYGGEIKRNRKVVKLVEAEGKIQYAELENGERVHGSHFISNAHPVNTMEMVESDLIRHAYKSRLKSLENSISTLLVNVVFKKDSYRYINSNYYYCNDYRNIWNETAYKVEDWPTSFAVFFSASSKSDVYADGATLMAYMRYEEVAPWAGTFNTVGHENDRGESYRDFKREKAEKLIDLVETKFPGLREHIQSYYVATPLSFRDYIGTDDGSMYGIAKDYKAPWKTFISPRTKIPNLLLTGQNINLHGILGVSVSALVTCFEFVDRKELIDEIRNAGKMEH